VEDAALAVLLPVPDGLELLEPPELLPVEEESAAEEVWEPLLPPVAEEPLPEVVWLEPLPALAAVAASSPVVALRAPQETDWHEVMASRLFGLAAVQSDTHCWQMKKGRVWV